MGDELDGRAGGGAQGGPEYDVAIVGREPRGLRSAAIMLGRAGARVALIDQRPEASAFKRICTHYIQSSAVATLERAGLARADARGRARSAPARASGRAGVGSSPPKRSMRAERRQPPSLRPRPAGAGDRRRNAAASS